MSLLCRRLDSSLPGDAPGTPARSTGRSSPVCCPAPCQGRCAAGSGRPGLRCLWVVTPHRLCAGSFFTCQLRDLGTDLPNPSLQKLETVETHTRGGCSAPGASGSLTVPMLGALSRCVSERSPSSKAGEKQRSHVVIKPKDCLHKGLLPAELLVLPAAWAETASSKTRWWWS